MFENLGFFETAWACKSGYPDLPLFSRKFETSKLIFEYVPLPTYTVCIKDLDNLYFAIVIWLKAIANYWYCPSGLKNTNMEFKNRWHISFFLTRLSRKVLSVSQILTINVRHLFSSLFGPLKKQSSFRQLGQ